MNKKSTDIVYFKNTIVDTINQMMYQNGWSIKQLSEKAELPYESVKKLVGGKISNPTIYSLIQICKAFRCSLDTLVNWKSVYDLRHYELPTRTYTLLSEIAEFEAALFRHNQSHETYDISVLVPTGILQDGMIFDSFYQEQMNIAGHTYSFAGPAMCGLKITGTALHPTYLKHDVLLVSKDRFPNNGENGIFLIHHKLYFRTFFQKEHILLAPVNGIGDPIEITDISDLHFFGRIVTVLRQ